MINNVWHAKYRKKLFTLKIVGTENNWIKTPHFFLDDADDADDAGSLIPSSIYRNELEIWK